MILFNRIRKTDKVFPKPNRRMRNLYRQACEAARLGDKDALAVIEDWNKYKSDKKEYYRLK